MEERIERCKKEIMCYRGLSYYHDDNEMRYILFKLCHRELSWEDVITQVEIGLDDEFYFKVKPISTPNLLTVLVNKFRQLPRDYIPGDLEMITPKYNQSTLILRRPARIQFEEMCQAAEKEGIRLRAISTFRSYLYQNQVYYKNWLDEVPIEKYRAERDRVSARAGHSEHQTGLAVDINDLEETFADTLEGRWLAEYAYQYGYVLRYPKGKEAITGYAYEPWHFRYIGIELAEQLYQSGLTYDEYYVRYLDRRECID